MKTQNGKREIKVNAVVNIAEDNEIKVLEYLFCHSDNFKGAVGSTFYPVDKAYYKERLKKDNVIEYLTDAGLSKSDALEAYRQYKDNGNLYELMFDTSYSELWDYLRTFGYTEKEYPIFECVGGGRCFDADFTGNKNEYLHKYIRRFES
jgi:hypothetical protein